jgi:MFS family permease
LFAIPPTTTFLSVFIWATVVAGIVCAKKNGDDDNKDDGNNGRRIKSFQILYLIILLAAIFQTSIAFTENPIYMMIFIYISGIFQSPIKPMLDAMIMDNLNDRSNFGKVRLFGIMGSGFGTNLGGFVLNKMQSIVDYDDRDNNRYWSYVKKMSGFDVLFIVRMVLTILPLICIRQFQNGSTCSTTNTDNKLNRRESENKKASQIGINTSSTKYKEGSIRWMAEGVVNNCFQDKAHLLFFIFVFIAGASGGVSDAFSCE